MKGKRSLSFIIGIALIILTTLMLVTIPLWTNRWSNVDFPCEWFGTPPDTIELLPNARIAYCITVYPHNAFGAAPLTYGSSIEESLIIPEYDSLNIQRQGTSLLVNKRALGIGETYSQHFESFTINPWLLSTTDLSIKNEGMQKSSEGQSDIIFVSGNAREGWQQSPLGLLFFAIGLSLLIFDSIQRKREAHQT